MAVKYRIGVELSGGPYPGGLEAVDFCRRMGIEEYAVIGVSNAYDARRHADVDEAFARQWFDEGSTVVSPDRMTDVAVVDPEYLEPGDVAWGGDKNTPLLVLAEGLSPDRIKALFVKVTVEARANQSDPDTEEDEAEDAD